MAAEEKQLTGLEKASVLIMSLSASASAEVFEHLSADERELLGAQILRLDEVDVDTRERVLAEATRARVEIVRGSDGRRPARGLLGRLRGRMAPQPVVSGFEIPKQRQHQSVSAQNVTTPEDLVGLPDESIRAVLAQIPTIDISHALHAASGELRDAVLRNLPPGISVCVQGLLNCPEHPTLSEIEAARQRIVHELRAVGLGREAVVG
jgi:flagellar motor switch protein FliG